MLVLPLRWLNPVSTSFMLRDDMVSSAWIYQNWTTIDNIAPVMQIAVIASEDQKFPQHNGFDFKELNKVLRQKGGPKRGASTITQQLVKNIYLWQGQSITRKLVEAYFTIWVEVLLPKERILELYLNVIEYGHGVYGITQASDVFFAKTPSELNRIEASLLAAVLPNPKKMLVQNPSPYVYSRAVDIRFSIRRLGGEKYLEWLQ